jgi:hypothetical protein
VSIDSFAETHRQWGLLFGKNSRYKGFGALIRALAMHYSFNEYQKPMSQFVDKWCSGLKTAGIDEQALLTRLDHIMYAMVEAFEKTAFRLEESKPINSGLLDCMIHAGLILTPNSSDLPDLEELSTKLKGIREQLLSNSKFRDSVTKDTSTREPVQYRLQAVEDLIL